MQDRLLVHFVTQVYSGPAGELFTVRIEIVVGLPGLASHDSDDHPPLPPSGQRAFCLGLFSGEFP